MNGRTVGITARLPALNTLIVGATSMSMLNILRGCATIQLTRQQNTLIDEQDYRLLSGFRWYALSCPHPPGFYAARSHRPSGGKKGVILMHRAILAELSLEVHIDHRDHDGLNNTRDNLRRASRSDNACNAQKRCFPGGTSSPYKGVARNKKTGSWTAYITKNHKRCHLGTFGSEIEAASAYDEAARELHREFMLLNGTTWNGETTRIMPVSQFRGVSWHKRKLRWRATIEAKGKQHHLGYFLSEEDAALAYNAAAIELYGEFARINEVV